jgi:hypothetical protein
MEVREMEEGTQKQGRETGNVPDSRFDYFGCKRTAPSRRIVSPLM